MVSQVLRSVYLQSVTIPHLLNVNAPKDVYQTMQIKWMAPPINVLKINTDGCVLSSDKAGAASIFRDHNGKWIWGTSRALSHTPIILAELWAIHDGVMEATKMVSITMLLNRTTRKLLILLSLMFISLMLGFPL